ncbi:hypothetical protein CASFOL_010656 [Castilleja foliolosa]|uniref:NAD-dependent epimerase/dehydratase domain-containing protein n=1 Tax=Castilleja foliolosa TaxID=1961234 RepID=A0ABD3DXF3_9LAMI
MKKKKMESRNQRKEKTYCVTGATGYIGSWLVKSLLQRGHRIHATLRNPEKASHMLERWQSMEQRLSLFRADLHEDGSFDDAVRGCDGVFHVAASMELGVPAVHDPAIKASGWVYVLSKLLTEEAAFDFAEKNGIDLVSLITTTVGGPFLTPTVPISTQVLLSPVTGDAKMLSILESVSSRMGSIAMVHIEDICSAHIFLIDHPNAEGRYICCTRSCLMSELVLLLKNDYPCSVPQRLESMERESIPCEISSKKIRDIGFKFKYSIQDIIHQTVRGCVESGFLS